MLQKRYEDLLAKDGDIAFRIKLIDEAVKAAANAALQQYGLTLVQMRVIGFLGNREGHACPQKDLEEAFCVRHSTMIGLIKRLCAKGLVAAETHPEDRRKRIIRLTERGEAVCRELKGLLLDVRTRMLNGLTREEIDRLSELLGRVYANLTDKTPQ